MTTDMLHGHAAGVRLSLNGGSGMAKRGSGGSSKPGVHTVPNPDGLGWVNKVAGEVVSKHRTKENAVERGAKEAKGREAEHTIHKKDGTIGEKNSYGNDPNPPKDKKLSKEANTVEPPTFFVPAAATDQQEEVYVQLAKFCRQPAQPADRRIYSITYVHDGETWTATVGERLRGTGTRTKRIKGKKVEQSYSTNDPAIVLAIFPGCPYVVATNHRLGGNMGSAWENPFLAGQPKNITYFKP